MNLFISIYYCCFSQAQRSGQDNFSSLEINNVNINLVCTALLSWFLIWKSNL